MRDRQKRDETGERNISITVCKGKEASTGIQFLSQILKDGPRMGRLLRSQVYRLEGGKYILVD